MSLDTGTRMKSSAAIADELGRPRPTDEQVAVIEAPPRASALVIAGAGSGKTETMASRVLWLVANGHARPEQILGLTFTRKAAGELGTRIRTLLHRLQQEMGHGTGDAGADPFDEPTVATYNSFANTIQLENAALLGRDPDGPVFGEAAAWQLARTVVLGTDDPRMPDLDRSLVPVVDAVLGLSRAISENVADPEAVRAFGRDFAEVSDLAPGGRGEYADVAAWARDVGSLDLLVELAELYRAEKERRSAIEYADQIALALHAVRARPEVGEELRRRFPVVLLDEYQDTSVVQTRLLRELFAPRSGGSASAVTAVGDPNQSIYGWRGASASNLRDFATDFRAERTFSLTTSWRNGTRILDAANTLVGLSSGLRPADAASRHVIDVRVEQTIDAETAAVADWLRDRVGTAADPRIDTEGTRPTAALLFRSRRTQARFLAALRDRDVPYHVLGLGGLLAEPEVADLVSALTVLADPTAGLELVRLLAGARWRIGPADLHALSRLAAWLRERDDRQQHYDPEVAERMRASVAAADRASLIDALDALRWMRDGHSELARFSLDGLERLRDAARTLEALRAQAASELPDLAALIEQELRLDIEVAANEHRPPGGAAMEAFHDALRGYLELAEAGTLAGFLHWLRAAEQKEDLSPRPEPPEAGVVQVLTIHGAKGLEWDVVAVPRLVEDELPARPQEGTGGWLRFGELPWDFRGDADSLPELRWRDATTRKELIDLVGKPDDPTTFKGRVRERLQAEERRLAYVAVTRARHRLLLSASFWAGQTQPRVPSRFLVELADAGRIPPVPAAPDDPENPLAELTAPTFPWPRDPLGSPRRREVVQRAAARVATATPRLAGPWAGEIELLVAERRARLDATRRVPLPTRVAASRFHDFVGDPEAVARGMLRPMPERPFRATRLGTLFHSWVERRYGLVGGSDELDAEPFELDDAPVEGAGAEAAPSDLAALRTLQQTFAASEWAARRPIEVEREIHLPFDGRIVVCKIDAVYELPSEDGEPRYEVIDWKTGRAPVDDEDLARKRLQLALYRLAYARWRGIDPSRIDAAFYFVADDRVVRPERLESEAELAARWRAATGSPVNGGTRSPG